MILISLNIDEDARCWSSLQTADENFFQKIAQCAFSFIEKKPKEDIQIDLFLTDDPYMQHINKTYRGKDSPTNVLSFPLEDTIMKQLDGSVLWGTVVLSWSTLEKEALEKEIPLKAHLTHLFIHGFLHLFGYDHETDLQEKEMKSLEWDILKALGLQMIQEKEESECFLI